MCYFVETIPDASWPSLGEIEFDNVSLRYDSSLEPVIKNLDLHIKGGQKVHIWSRGVYYIIFLYSLNQGYWLFCQALDGTMGGVHVHVFGLAHHFKRQMGWGYLSLLCKHSTRIPKILNI